MKQAMSKRILCLFLALFMALGVLPMGVLAEEFAPPETITVYFTMSNQGVLQLSKNGTDGLVRIPMKIPVGSRVVDALKEAHRQYCADGENGYAESGGYFSKFWGVTTQNIGLFKNGSMVMDSTMGLSEGDDLEASIYKDATADLYTRFNKQELILAVNQTVELTLLCNTISTPDWSGGMMAGEAANKPLSGARILTDVGSATHIPLNSSHDWVTDNNGKVNISFDTPGTYYLSAAKENSKLIPSLCKITVETQETLDAAVAADKAALNFAAIRGANTATDPVTQALSLPKTGQSGKTTITWDSENKAMIKNDGSVFRPAPQSGNQTATLTATISYGSVTDTKTIPVTVLAFTQEDVEAERGFLQEVSTALTFDTICKLNSQATSVTTDLSKPQLAIKADDEITFSTTSAQSHGGASITWTSSNPAVISNELKVTRPTENTSVTLTASITSPRFANCPDVSELKKPFALTVPAVELSPLLDTIAANYAQKPSQWWGTGGTWWSALGMGAYQSYTGGTKNLLSAEAKQAFINKSISAISTSSGSASNDANQLANAINGLSAFGCDPSALWTANKTKLDAVSALKMIKLDDAKKGWYATIAPYVLTALHQGSFNSSAQEQAHVSYLLAELPKTQTYIDSYAMMLQGLSYYYDQPEVKTAVDAAITHLSAIQGANGSFGNANSDAMVILALSQRGICADTDAHFIKDGNSLLDGLLRYRLTSNDGFGNSNNTERNELATQQGFLALIAAAQVNSKGSAYDVLSCTAVPKTPAYANGNPGSSLPTPPSGTKELTLSLSVKVGNETWLPSTSVTLKEGASVYHAFTSVLTEKHFTYTGAESGYVRSIAKPDGTKLSELDQGPNSGWLYKVNGRLPDVDLTACKVSEHDQIVWYYTPDWTKDEEASKAGSSGGMTKPVTPTSDKIETVAPSTTVSHGTATATVSTSEANKALESVKNNNGSELLIAPVITGDVKKVSVSVPKDALASLAKDTKAALTVQSPVASIRLSTAALSTISGETGSSVSISAEQVDASKMSDANKALVGDHPVYQFSLTVGDKAVTDFKGSVTVSLPYTLKAGEDPQKLTIYYLDPQGKASEMEGARYDATTKSIVFETTHFSTFAVAYDDSKLLFTDVAQSDWFYPAVKFTLASKLFSGTSEKNFSPKADTSRAMLFTVLHRMSGTAKETSTELWYSAGMSWAKTAGISDGSEPTVSLTREQLATMLYRYAIFKGYDASKTADLSAYTDKGEVSAWAQKGMCWAVGQGLIAGRTATTLVPQGNATRAEVAVIIQRFMERVAK